MSLEVGNIIDGRVSGITNFGAFIQLPEGKTGLVHISEVSNEYVKDIKGHLEPNQEVKVKVLSIENNGKISLSIKKAIERPRPQNTANTERRSKPMDSLSFEERLSKFMKESDERILDLKKNFESKRGSGTRRNIHF